MLWPLSYVPVTERRGFEPRLAESESAVLPLGRSLKKAGDGIRTHILPLTRRRLIQLSYTSKSERRESNPLKASLEDWCAAISASLT